MLGRRVLARRLRCACRVCCCMSWRMLPEGVCASCHLGCCSRVGTAVPLPCTRAQERTQRVHTSTGAHTVCAHEHRGAHSVCTRAQGRTQRVHTSTGTHTACAHEHRGAHSVCTRAQEHTQCVHTSTGAHTQCVHGLM